MTRRAIFTEGFQRLGSQLRQSTSRESKLRCLEDFVQEWAEFGPEEENLAYTIYEIVSSALETNNASPPVNLTYITIFGDVMGDNIQNRVGGDQVASAIGRQNLVSISNSSQLGRHVENLPRLDSKIAELIKACGNGIESLEITPGLKEELIGNLGKISTELNKNQPDKTILAFLWRSINHFASAVRPVVDLGQLLIDIYGVVDSTIV